MKSERISPFWVGGYHPFSALRLLELTAFAGPAFHSKNALLLLVILQ